MVIRADVAVFVVRGNSRSRMIGPQLAIGAQNAGLRVMLLDSDRYHRPVSKVAAFYGYEGKSPQIMEDYIAAGRRVVFVDLGYWGRREGGRFEGFHKVAIDGRHPSDDQMSRAMPHDRLERFKLRIRPWAENGEHILVAGMSDRISHTLGYEPGQWETETIQKIRRHTDRPIIYRPKPSWRTAFPIRGSEFRPAGTQTLEDALGKCWAVVTRHSNVAVDAIVRGVPVFAWDGAPAAMASQDLSQIENPYRPGGRKQWLANVAYCQWRVKEMSNGAMWRHLKAERLIS